MTAPRSFSDIHDANSRQELEDTLAQLRETWPGLRFDITIKSTQELVTPGESYEDALTTMGQTNNLLDPPEVAISEPHAANYHWWQRELKTGIDNGVISAHVNWQRPAEYTLVHEVGHVFTRNAIGLFDETTDEEYRRAAQIAMEAGGEGHVDLDSIPWVYSLMAAVGPINLHKDLSGYAVVGGPTELTAEAFAVATLAPGKSKAADAVFEYLKSKYEALVH